MITLVLIALATAGGAAAPPGRTVSFSEEIYPLLTRHCLRCHQGHNPASGPRLDSRAEILGESSGKPLARAGDAANSRLVRVVSGKVPDRVMPPEGRGKRLSEAQVRLLRDWVDQGLPWDEKLLPPPAPPAHWAFRPVRRPSSPDGIDAFLAEAWRKQRLTPVGEAPRRVLIRRLYLDLHGLPPSPDNVAAFEKDGRPDAYERLVDRLLASPRHGERYARHWLDVARHADSEGYESNHLRPHAWRYRDWVIDAINRDRPFAEFVTLQLAGDEIRGDPDDGLVATGFLAAARLSSNEEDVSRQRNDVLVDIVNTTASAFLGLTMNCAQCHSHKFDPVTARDYYRFLAFFTRGQPANVALSDAEAQARWRSRLPAGYEAAHERRELLFEQARERLVRAALEKMPEGWRAALAVPADRRTDAQEALARQAELKLNFGTGQVEREVTTRDRKEYEDLKKRLSGWEKTVPEEPQTFAYLAPGTSRRVLPMKGFYPPRFEPESLSRLPTRLLVAGDVNQRGPAVTPGWPALFGPTPELSPTPRQALARWLTSETNPLVARVWVNRVWQWHFGTGLVATPGDFGVKGAPPSHPELLDWLASELLATGSTKHLHRLIVTSRAYRLASVRARAPSEGLGSTFAWRSRSDGTRDPDNRYLWRWKPRRLEAEVLRDAMLTVSGELDGRPGGPGDADEAKSRRRGIYLFQKRDNPPMLAALFDAPIASAESCPRRGVSTVPLQALYLLNNGFVRQRAHGFAARIENASDRVGAAFQLALSRPPDEAERAAAERFFERHGGGALESFCQALLSINEFVYLE